MRCENCGVMLPQDAVRCPNCGAPRGSGKIARLASRATGIPTRSFKQSSYGPPVTEDTDAPGSVVMERLTGPHRAVGYRPIIPPPPPAREKGCLQPIAIAVVALLLLAIVVLLLVHRSVLGM
jgi:hypothetical protein